MNGFSAPLQPNAFTREIFWLGTDDQGRDAFSTILCGMRISPVVGVSAVLVEKNQEYLQAVRLIGRSGPAIMLRHILPNVMSPVLVIATISLALALSVNLLGDWLRDAWNPGLR